jgi:hypothetical protein
VPPTALVETGWRFSTNYVPQHYGNWKFDKGSWNFGADDRIQCESCGYCLYYAVDQLGDGFDAEKVSKVLDQMVGQVQWVFRSACDHIVKHSKKTIVASMMKLVEPQVGVVCLLVYLLGLDAWVGGSVRVRVPRRCRGILLPSDDAGAPGVCCCAAGVVGFWRAPARTARVWSISATRLFVSSMEPRRSTAVMIDVLACVVCAGGRGRGRPVVVVVAVVLVVIVDIVVVVFVCGRKRAGQPDTVQPTRWT